MNWIDLIRFDWVSISNDKKNDIVDEFIIDLIEFLKFSIAVNVWRRWIIFISLWTNAGAILFRLNT